MNYQVRLEDLYEILTGEMDPSSSRDGAILYNHKFLMINLVHASRSYKKAPELAIPRYVIDVKHIIAMSGKYIPVYDENKNLLYTYEEFLEYSKKVKGFITLPTGPYIFSGKLDFPGMEKYLEVYNQNEEENAKNNKIISDSLTRIMDDANKSLFPLFKAKRTIKYNLVNTGSTARNTNLPGSGADFDYVLKYEYASQKDREKKESYMVKVLMDAYHLTPDKVLIRPYRIRMFGVKVPGYSKPVDIDVSFVGINRDYLSTDGAIKERLTVMRMQDELSYRKVVANIQYAKKVLKDADAYKAYRSDHSQGGLGGVGVENWILQHGGSFIEAAEEFVASAFTSNGQLKPFIDFEKEYYVMDCGKNHVSFSRGLFPYDNFVMGNMREKGYEKMAYALKKQLEIIREGNRAR